MDDDGFHQFRSLPHDSEPSSDIRFADSEVSLLKMIKDGSNEGQSLEPVRV